jgi:acyl-CoA reductase-like NAD-dependent aldehyde dehydrogenase
MDLTNDLLHRLHVLQKNQSILIDISQRIAVLKRLKQMVLQNQKAIYQAISQDFRYRSANETRLGEILPLCDEINHFTRHLKRWCKPKYHCVTPWYLPASAKTVLQPLGVIGIIVPWNYPLFLGLSPLAGAIAAGNACMVKMSNLSPQLGNLLATLFERYFPENIITIVNGDLSVAEQFSQLPFNHLLFTGSSNVGKKIMAAASQNLTPVTLELGGKSPVIIDDKFNMTEAVTCIIRGKLLNAGQTCVSPDYVFVPKAREHEFIETAKKIAKKLYPTLINNPDYSAIINDQHWQRIQSLVQDAQQQGATWVALSETINTSDTIKFQPGLLLQVQDSMQVMQQEIFGPILSVKTYENLNEAIDYINCRPNPLALYCFTRNKTIKQQLIAKTLSGGLTFNETIVQIVQNNLPFGGVGQSGMGHYYGRYSVEAFSKLKPIYTQGRFHSANFLKPPYGNIFKWTLNLLIR